MKALLSLLALLAAAPATESLPDFRDIAESAGLTHVFPNGGMVTKEFIIETTGSGVAFIDYDNDGLPDIWVGSGDGAPSRLYHNEGRNRFRDVSAEMGFTRIGWAQAACAGDYDNDGYTDLFITYWGQNSLYHNEAGKGFKDVTKQAGLSQNRTRYNLGCAFLDYDHDGRLDLFVSNYLKFSFEETPKPGANPYCWYMQMPVNCGPRGLPFDTNLLYHGNADGTFTDVSEKSGISDPKQNYSLSAMVADYDGDGWPDIYVSCDVTPSLLYMNQKDGTFAEEGVLRGAAFDDNGKAMSGMGSVAADYNHSGWLSLFRTNFSDERETLYRNRGQGEFEDATVNTGMAHNTRFVGWGSQFLDFDNDGWKDLLLVNGHVFPEVERKNIDIHFKERRICYRNARNGKFEDISERAGQGVLDKHSSRGVAVADIDNDGAVEVLVNNQGERPSLLKMANPPAGNWVILKLEGTRSNRSAIGATVKLTAAGMTQFDEVHSGGGYASQNDLRLHFGLAKAEKIDKVEIAWPSGLRQTVEGLAVNRIHAIKEPAAN